MDLCRYHHLFDWWCILKEPNQISYGSISLMNFKVKRPYCTLDKKKEFLMDPFKQEK